MSGHETVEAIADVMRRSRLRWHGHVERKGKADCVVEKGAAPVSRTYVQKGEREGGSGGMN